MDLSDPDLVADILSRPPPNPTVLPDSVANTIRALGLNVASDVKNLVMAPGRAMEHGVTTDEAIPWAHNLSLNLLGTAAPFAQQGAAGIFGGRLSKTADQTALAKAEKMAAAGVPREQIWNDTGWFQGSADKQWRYEIPDDKAKLTRDWLTHSFVTSPNKVSENTYAQVGRSIEHPDLMAAYPDVAPMGYSGRFEYGPDTRLQRHHDTGQVVTGSGGGSYWPSRDSIDASGFGLSRPQAKEGVLSTTLHELTHGIQAREKFAPGANPEEIARGLSENTGNPIIEQLRRAISSGEYGGPGDPGFREAAGNLLNLERQSRTERARDIYHRTAGEVEARNVQKRMHMTPEERKSKPPWETEDVLPDQQIFDMFKMRKNDVQSSKPHSLDEFSNYWGDRGVRNYVSESKASPNTLKLHDLVVPKEKRKQGIGTEFMNELVNMADDTGKMITLTAAKDYGSTSLARLKDFYKRFGFVENKGRNYDPAISDNMYRPVRRNTQ